MRILILGGTRFVGKTLSAMLVEAGADVTVLHRGVAGAAAPGVTSVIGDRSEPRGLDALDGQRFDSVVDLSAYFSAWTEDAVNRLAGSVRHYVFISSGAVYRPAAELPWLETTPVGPNPIWGAYAIEKTRSEEIVRAAEGRGAFSATIFRYPFILGPANFADRESFVFSRLAAGRPILLPGGGAAVNQFVYCNDVAAALVAALERPDIAGGSTYNCAHGRGITNKGWVELCAHIAGLEADLISVDVDELDVASPTVDLTNFVFPYPDEHYVLDSSKLEHELKIEMGTGNQRMLEEYHQWWEALPADRKVPKAYDRETRALVALGIAVSQPDLP